MAYFQTGDRVTVRHDLQYETYRMDDGSALWCVLSDMIKLAGQEFVISKVNKNGYHLDDPGGWSWTDEMFEEYIHRFDDAGEFETAEPADIISLIGVR